MAQPQPNRLQQLMQSVRDNVPALIYVVIVLAVLIGFAYALWKPNDLIAGLSEANAARGVITLLIAVTFVIVALLLTLFALTGRDDNDAKRFDNGKQVLSILVGVLGTILGFYFGSTKDEAAHKPLAVVEVKLDLPSVKASGALTVSGQIAGGKPPYRYTITTEPPVIEPITGISNDGKIEAKPVIKAEAKPGKVKLSIFAFDADNKVAGNDQQTFEIVP